MTTQRYNYLDFLRFIGISMIILAHVNPGFIIGQVRCFDVPLMLFTSGLAFSGKKVDSFCNFALNRTKRLVFPIYIFFAIYFALLVILNKVGIASETNLSLTTILSTFLLLNSHSIGYVWIIKVFLLIMLLTPLLLKINRSLSGLYWWVFIVVLFGSLELSVLWIDKLQYTNKYLYYILYEIIPYSIAYSIPFLFGLKLRHCSKKNEIYTFCILLFVVIAFIIFGKSCIVGGISPVYKFPPRTIFILYGIFTSSLLWMFRSCKTVSFLADTPLFLFIGQNTIWIYLWHIPFVSVFNAFVSSVIVRYILVYLCSLAVFFVQYSLVNRGIKNKNYPILKYFLG